MDLSSLVLERTPELVLHFLRAAAFIRIAPVFSGQSGSRMLQLILAISLGSVFFWTTPAIGDVPDSVLGFAAVAAREVFIGLLAGFALRAIIALLSVAGELLSHEMGFSMARVMDPDTGSASTPMSLLFQSIAFLIILHLDLHHEFLRVLQSTYASVPIGDTFEYSTAFERLGGIISSSISYGLRYAIPIYAVMILLTVTLVVLARAVQNINLMEFSFGLRILLALFASIYFLSEGAPFLIKVIKTITAQSGALFVGT